MAPKKSLRSSAISSFRGEVTVPGDKSLSHRALIFASQALGHSTVTGLLEGEDVLDTAKILRACGVSIQKQGDIWHVDGVGVGGLKAPSEALDAGNSGTGVRLLMGLIGSYPFASTFVGDESLSKRPMQRVLTPLEQMGISVESQDGKLPVTLEGHRELAPITYESPVASAQLKSCILLAGLNISGKTTVIERMKTRDHTERMLKAFGGEIEVVDDGEGSVITLTGHPTLQAQDVVIPADPSSAAFLVVAALITPGAEITLRNVLQNPARTGVFVTLAEMGADIEYINQRDEAGEPVADMVVKHSALRGVTIPASRAASMIDEYPILAIAASYAQGTTHMAGLEELRVKESDRLSAMVHGLTVSGVKVESTDDSMTVHGDGVFPGNADIAIPTHLDHRIAMSFLIAGLGAQQDVVVDDGAMIATSFPNFVSLINECGGQISE